MRNLKTFAAVLFALAITLSCEEATSESTDEVNTETSNKDEQANQDVEREEAPEEVEDLPQTVEERILEIKELYAQIQKSNNQKQDCISKSKTTMNYDVIEEGIPFENKVKKCQLKDELMYEQVEMNGYEWQETAHFYYKNNQRFFTYVTGGAEAYGYDYRVYYDRDGEVIRVLLAENDYDGEEVSASVEVKDEKRKKEILDAIAYAKKEMEGILNEN